MCSVSWRTWHLILLAEKTVRMRYSNSCGRTGTAGLGYFSYQAELAAPGGPSHPALWIICFCELFELFWLLQIGFCPFLGDFWALWARFLSRCPGSPVRNSRRQGQRQDWDHATLVHRPSDRTGDQQGYLPRKSQVHPAYWQDQSVSEDSREQSKAQAHLQHSSDKVWVLRLELCSWATGRGCWWGSWTRLVRAIEKVCSCMQSPDNPALPEGNSDQKIILGIVNCLLPWWTTSEAYRSQVQ